MCRHPPSRNRRAVQFGDAGANLQKNNDFIFSAATAGAESTESERAKQWHGSRRPAHLAV
jgi:hypothetical protein